MNYVEAGGIRISYSQAGSGDLTLVFLHGNSMSSKIFGALLKGQLAKKYHLLAFDLPGHGDSDDASNPEATYTLPGYASVISLALDKLKIKAPILIGFSLGGNVAFEMAAGGMSLAGVVTIGVCPLPCDPARIVEGYQPNDKFDLGFKETMTTEEIETYSTYTLQGGASRPPEFNSKDIERTDGLARSTFIASVFAANYSDQLTWIASSPTPLAMILGGNDKVINIAHLRTLTFANLWRGTIQVLAGSGHAPFRDAPDDFNLMIEDFVRSL